MATKRKPYVQEVTSGWWKNNGFYKFYLLREGTSLFTIWFCLILLYGIFCLKDGIPGILNYVHFLQNPIILIINFFTLLAALLHSTTWFNLTPKAVNLIVKGKRLDSCVLVYTMWGITLIASLIVLMLVFA